MSKPGGGARVFREEPQSETTCGRRGLRRTYDKCTTGLFFLRSASLGFSPANCQSIARRACSICAPPFWASGPPFWATDRAKVCGRAWWQAPRRSRTSAVDIARVFVHQRIATLWCAWYRTNHGDTQMCGAFCLESTLCPALLCAWQCLNL